MSTGKTCTVDLCYGKSSRQQRSQQVSPWENNQMVMAGDVFWSWSTQCEPLWDCRYPGKRGESFIWAPPVPCCPPLCPIHPSNLGFYFVSSKKLSLTPVALFYVFINPYTNTFVSLLWLSLMILRICLHLSLLARFRGQGPCLFCTTLYTHVLATQYLEHGRQSTIGLNESSLCYKQKSIKMEPVQGILSYCYFTKNATPTNWSVSILLYSNQVSRYLLTTSWAPSEDTNSQHKLLQSCQVRSLEWDPIQPKFLKCQLHLLKNWVDQPFLHQIWGGFQDG